MIDSTIDREVEALVEDLEDFDFDEYKESRSRYLGQLSLDDLLVHWKSSECYEVELLDKDHREFVEEYNGEWTTIVYHFLDIAEYKIPVIYRHDERGKEDEAFD